MKNTLKILVALFIITAMLCLVSCGFNASGGTDGTTEDTTTECTHDNMRRYGEESTCLVGGWFTEECYECGYCLHADLIPRPFTSVIKEKLSDTRFVLTVDEKYREELGETVFINIETHQDNSALPQSLNVGTALKAIIGSYSGHDTIDVEPMEIWSSGFSVVELQSKITATSSGNSVQPYPCPVFDEVYFEDDDVWMNADGMGNYKVFFDDPQRLADVPTLNYADDLSIQISSNALQVRYRVYDPSPEHLLVKHNSQTLDFLKELPSGEWYVSVYVVWQGDYIEKYDKYEAFGYDYVFRLIVE